MTDKAYPERRLEYTDNSKSGGGDDSAKAFNFGAAFLVAAAGASPATAQTFQNYRCAEGTQFSDGFSNTTTAPTAERRQGGGACQAVWSVRGPLFGQRRHVENHQDRRHGQTRQAAGDGLRTWLKRPWLGSGRRKGPELFVPTLSTHSILRQRPTICRRQSCDWHQRSHAGLDS